MRTFRHRIAIRLCVFALPNAMLACADWSVFERNPTDVNQIDNPNVDHVLTDSIEVEPGFDRVDEDATIIDVVTETTALDAGCGELGQPCCIGTCASGECAALPSDAGTVCQTADDGGFNNAGGACDTAGRACSASNLLCLPILSDAGRLVCVYCGTVGQFCCTNLTCSAGTCGGSTDPVCH
jgi:hypothetical protein